MKHPNPPLPRPSRVRCLLGIVRGKKKAKIDIYKKKIEGIHTQRTYTIIIHAHRHPLS